MFTFVTGGLRSGKSAYALHRASELGPPPWLYVAPRIDGDDELKARIANHRRDQEATWRTLEAPEHLEDVLTPAALEGCGSFIIDRFTVWLSNRVARGDASGDRALLDEIERLADRLYRSPTPGVVVTTEVGLGFLPANVPDRRLVDVVGLANQILSDRASAAALLVSGMPLRLR
ncbi:MAG TPA: bifunctional adenosylcobinamide kinase/adenosylcobinamide-phosphate guanylyltransferase [Polyangia bacterium]|nr:bifunctional adenosylcobinamide kinase/adenosylcobinamide-phosphate guanylyltransferase [Polyangia bacterium]